MEHPKVRLGSAAEAAGFAELAVLAVKGDGGGRSRAGRLCMLYGASRGFVANDWVQRCVQVLHPASGSFGALLAAPGPGSTSPSSRGEGDDGHRERESAGSSAPYRREPPAEQTHSRESRTAAPSAPHAAMQASPKLSIDVSYDLICPWCLIGKRHLDSAISQLRAERPDLAIDVEWRSLPLIPDTPLAGIPYREFYVARLGSPQAVAARQAQVRAAAQAAGLALALEQIDTFPNTLLAHRLVRFARQAQGAQAAADLVENLFTRFFVRAENIGDPQVLRQALLECGIAVPGGAQAPLQHESPWLPPVRDPHEPAQRGITGVPHFAFNGRPALSGAQPPAALLQAMRLAIR